MPLSSQCKDRNIVLAITGASGAAYAVRLLRAMLEADCRVHLAISPLGYRLLAEEMDMERPSAADLAGGTGEGLHLHEFGDLASPLASGTFRTDGMVICPCSSNTLGAIASGIADSCITRAAAVHLKERRRLVLVHRETPLSRIDLENMLRVDAAGAIVCPASPGFYMRPRSVEEIVDFVAGKVLDLLGIDHPLIRRWQPGGVAAADGVQD